MDTSVHPGADFNAFANGAYLRNTPIPGDKTSYGTFDMLYDRSPTLAACCWRWTPTSCR